MEWLYLITGFIFAALVPFFGAFELKSAAFYICIALFLELVTAYVILSIAKFLISRYNFVKNQTIVSWDAGRTEKKQSYLPYYISCLTGIVIGCGIDLTEAGLLDSVFIALFFAFTVLGWWLVAKKRVQAVIDDTDSFVLAHNGMLYNGRLTVFDGVTKGILKASRRDDKLVLNVLYKKSENKIEITIPEGKSASVDEFLNDLKEFFNEKQ